VSAAIGSTLLLRAKFVDSFVVFGLHPYPAIPTCISGFFPANVFIFRLVQKHGQLRHAPQKIACLLCDVIMEGKTLEHTQTLKLKILPQDSTNVSTQ